MPPDPRPDPRPDPDALLAGMVPGGQGRLKIFLGAAPGVGKTWEMLVAANIRRKAGVDVAAGFIETHGRAGTAAEIAGLEVLPRCQITHRGHTLEEFDLDAALARRPALLLVDELAHTNAPGLRHAKRWQDVQEILAAGINVWTTLNVQHLESQSDAVARITGIRVAETLPDTVLDLADEIELIDLPPAELRARLSEGKIYRADIATRALAGFFREGNLGALREMALRRVAQRVDKDVASYMRQRAIAGPWPASERVLALIGPDRAATEVVRHAARLAEALRAPLMAFHAERPDDTPDVQTALQLAVQLGGQVATTTLANASAALLAYAARHNVTHIVAGRAPRHSWWPRWLPRWLPVFWPGRGSMGQVLLREAQAFTLHIIPVPAALPPPRAVPPASLLTQARAWRPYAIMVLALGGVTAAGLLLRGLIPQEAMGLIFTALIAASASMRGRHVGLAAALLSFCLWDFFFLPPVFTFSVTDPRDLVALMVFLLVGILTGTLGGRVRQEAEAASVRVEALRRISLFGERFSLVTNEAELCHGIAAEAAAITTAGVVMLAENSTLQAPCLVPEQAGLAPASMAAADWAFRHNVETGIGTATLPASPWRFMPLRANGQVLGVLGSRPETMPPEPLAQTLAALAGQAATALERLRLTMAAAKAEAREGSQKLRTALLSSLSHDLRTPLTAIRGAAETLSAAAGALDAPAREDLLASISQNTTLMTKFLANIMDMARVETGDILARKERVDLGLTVESAITRVPGALYSGINIATDAGYVMADAALLEQVIVNCLDNAMKYAPPGSRAAVTARRQAEKITITLADEGVGISADALPHVFDSFFRATRTDRISTDTALGTGLGLAIAKAFTQAMGGTISASSPRQDLPADGLPGTIITIELPAA